MAGFLNPKGPNQNPNFIPPLSGEEKRRADEEWDAYTFDPRSLGPQSLERLTDIWEEAVEVPGHADEVLLDPNRMIFSWLLHSRRLLSDADEDGNLVTDYTLERLMEEIQGSERVLPESLPEPSTVSDCTHERYDGRLDELITASAFGNARRLQAAMSRLFENLSDAYQGPGAVSHITREIPSDELAATNTHIDVHTYRAVPAAHDAKQYQFGENMKFRQYKGGSTLEEVTGGFRARPDEPGRQEIAYVVQMRNPNVGNNISYVQAAIRLSNDVVVDIAYRCDEKGDFLPGPQPKEWVQVVRNGVLVTPDREIMQNIVSFFAKWGFSS